MDFSEVEKNTGYIFKNKDILRRALTLSSADGGFNNQSMECFGDSVLSFIVTEKLYGEGLDEGDITARKKALVSDEALTPVSEKLGLDRALIRGKGDNNNKKAVPSAFEALTAAVYLDGGMQAAKAFVLSAIDFDVKGETDYISALQEEVQSRGEKAPQYKKTECGTPRSPRYIAEVEVGGRTFSGEAQSFSSAKKEAAKSAYEYLTKQLT